MDRNQKDKARRMPLSNFNIHTKIKAIQMIMAHLIRPHFIKENKKKKLQRSIIDYNMKDRMKIL